MKAARLGQRGRSANELKPQLLAHEDDPWADVITLNGEQPLRLVIRERYKTSGLSGDEWRFSYEWQMKQGETWVPFDGGSSSQDASIARIYSGVYNSHQDWHDKECLNIQFEWKGQPLCQMSNEGESLPLLHALGHIAWSKIIARWQKKDTGQCCQPGCAEQSVGTFRLKDRYYPRVGVKMEKYREYYRQFCKAHLRRGDCGLEDADVNYELVKGLGPDGNEPDPELVSQSVFGGAIKLQADGGES